MGYMVRNYLPNQDKDSLLNVVREVWGEATVTRFLEQYDWYQTYNKQVAPFDHQDIIIDKDGEVAGYSRLINVYYKLGNKVVSAVHIADSVTHPNYRGCGVKLFRHIIQTQERLEIGVPVERTGVLWEKIAKRPVAVRSVVRHVLIMYPSGFLRQKGVPPFLGSMVDFFWQKKIRWTQKNRGVLKGKKRNLSKRNTPPTEQEFTELMHAFTKKFYAIALRDYRYFCWRFFNSPNHYQYLWIREDGQLIGYCIYRECQMNGRTVLLVVDMVAIGDQEGVYQEILRVLVHYALEKQYTDIQMIETGCDVLAHVLKKAGSVRKVEKTNLLAYILSDQPYATEMYQNKKWYMSLADGDYEFVMYPYMGNKGE